jgi:hypothetical protein
LLAASGVGTFAILTDWVLLHPATNINEIKNEYVLFLATKPEVSLFAKRIDVYPRHQVRLERNFMLNTASTAIMARL